MATTIDNLDISVYNLYALRTRMMEQISQEYHLSEAASVPPQTVMIDTMPRMTELDLLLGLVPVVTPWAYFFPPKQFRLLRRSPFRSRVAPSFGSREKQDEDIEKLSNIPCRTLEEKEEKEAIGRCLDQMDKINDWIDFIMSRIGQFLQG